MTQHNIIGSERPGAHILVSRAAPRRRSVFWWARMILEAVVCIAFVAMIWGALS